MARVVVPGVSVVVLVRTLDVPVFVTPGLPQSVVDKIQQTVYAPGVAPLGCADASLCERMHRVGLVGVSGSPVHIAGVDSIIGSRLLQVLTDEELTEFESRTADPWHPMLFLPHR